MSTHVDLFSTRQPRIAWKFSLRFSALVLTILFLTGTFAPLSALTPEQVNAAKKKYIGYSKLTTEATSAICFRLSGVTPAQWQ